MIRAFVGLSLPADVTARLTAVQAALPGGRTVAPEDMHITLVFLGEQPEPVLEDLHYALEGIGGAVFALRLAGLGMFGAERGPSLHAVVEAEPALEALQRRIATAARGTGIALARRRFVPHVTLARFARPAVGADAERLHTFIATHLTLKAGPFTVPAFNLFRSHLRRSGAVYEVLARYPLGS